MSSEGDGNNVVEVLKQATAAVRFIRGGGGPAFIEFQTSRWREHCGPLDDADLGLRTAAETAALREDCPLLHLKRHMLAIGIWDDEAIGKMMLEIEAEIKQAFAFAKSSDFPNETVLRQHEYAGTAAYYCDDGSPESLVESEVYS